MSIGTGIVLFVIGAILTFALNVTVTWANLHLIGYILMGAGALVFLLGLIFAARKRRVETVTRTMADPQGSDQVTRQSTSSTNDEPL